MSPWLCAARRPLAFPPPYGVWPWACAAPPPKRPRSSRPEFERICARLAGTRPTAVNLFWAIDRMKGLFANLLDSGATLDQIKDRILAEAHAMYAEDIAACKAMGAFGGALLPQQGGVLTHCNAGALATCGYGTALGVIRSAVEQGKQIQVFADETRPFLQGGTAHRVGTDGRPHSHHRDLRQHGRQASCRAGRIQAVVVGADRIAANGDVAQQDRHLQRRHPGPRARHSVLCSRSLVHHRPSHGYRRRHSHRRTAACGSDPPRRQAAPPPTAWAFATPLST